MSDTMINLLQETEQVLAANGKTSADVRWVGNSQMAIGWALFAEHADFSYNNGYGAEAISLSLMVVGDDWWLERHEYDGSEWWEFKTLPTMPSLAPVEPDSIIRSVWHLFQTPMREG